MWRYHIKMILRPVYLTACLPLLCHAQEALPAARTVKVYVTQPRADKVDLGSKSRVTIPERVPTRRDTFLYDAVTRPFAGGGPGTVLNGFAGIMDDLT
jgi:hypothetical protein